MQRMIISSHSRPNHLLVKRLLPRPVSVSHLGERSALSFFHHNENNSNSNSNNNNNNNCSWNSTRQQCRSLSSSSASASRPDPFARRPNQKCDPYGQGGQPLSLQDAERLKLTVSDEWELQSYMNINMNTMKPPPGGIIMGQEKEEDDDDDDGKDDIIVPTILFREFQHADFMTGSSFLTHVAAVAQMNDHFPSLQLERKLDSRKKAWRVVTSISCHTKVLQGLSHHDFFLATLIDVEIERPEVKSLYLQAAAEDSKEET